MILFDEYIPEPVEYSQCRLIHHSCLLEMYNSSSNLYSADMICSLVLRIVASNNSSDKHGVHSSLEYILKSRSELE